MSFPKSIELLAREAYAKGEDAVVALVLSLEQGVGAPSPMDQNSSNSSFPSSRDLGKKKKNNSRKKTDKKPGGQTGHKGSTLKQVDNPDVTVDCELSSCDCGHSFNGSEEFISSTPRQVFDIPAPSVTVTEYRLNKYRCPVCGQIHGGEFPAGVSAPTQYGSNLQAHIVYMMNYQMLPYKRTADMFENLFDISISEGTLRNIQHRFYQMVQKPVEAIKQHILDSKVIHADETGLYTEGDRHWLHVAATDLYTYYFCHKERGKNAMDAAGVISKYKGRIIHDFWSSYYKYVECEHGLCNAHHLRDLQGVIDRNKHEWAVEMKAFLSWSKGVVDAAKENGLTELNKREIEQMTIIYKGIIDRGYEEIPPLPERVKGVRGKLKKGKARNLLDRFKDRPDEVLGFIYDFSIPFDNNLAERDIRMMKVKQKISGTFRSAEMANAFCATRSYISTAIKQEINVFNAVSDAVQGRFFIELYG